MSCSRWLSIQSSLVLATPVDSHCASRESRRFGATKTSIPSTPFSTHVSLPGSRQIYRVFRKECQLPPKNYSGVGDGLGEAACSVEGAVAWLRGTARTLVLCTSSILRCLS